MSHKPRKISKSRGQTPTEESLSQLCDRTFLKALELREPLQINGKELCDLIAAFDRTFSCF